MKDETSMMEDLLDSSYGHGYTDGAKAFFDAYEQKAFVLPSVTVVAGCSIISNIELCRIMHKFGMKISQAYLDSLSEENRKYVLGE